MITTSLNDIPRDEEPLICCENVPARHICEYKQCNVYICDDCKRMYSVRMNGTVRSGSKAEGYV